MVASPTLGAAFERVYRYQRFIHDTFTGPARYNQGIAPSCHIACQVVWLHPARPPNCSLPRGCAPAALPLARGGVPLKYALHIARHSDSGEHERFFGAPLRFATGENALYSRRRFSTCPVVAPIPRCCRSLIGMRQIGLAYYGRRRSQTVPVRPYPRNCRRGTLRLKAWRRASASAFGRSIARSPLREYCTGGSSISYASTSPSAISWTIACRLPKSRFWWDSQISARSIVRSSGGRDARR